MSGSLFLLILLIILILALIISNVLFWIQQKILFQPSTQNYWQPPINPNISHLILHHDTRYSPIKLTLEDYPLRSNPDKKIGKFIEYLHVIHFHEFANRKTILFCHGNSGNNSHRKYMYDLAHTLHLNLLVFDYRGYGHSNGYPSRSILTRDAQLCYNHLMNTGHSPNDIIIWGESLGGHPALYVASKNPCYALILFSTFSNLTDLIGETFSSGQDTFFNKICSFILPNLISDILNCELIPLVTVPTVIIHSKEDNLVPMSCAQKLYKLIGHEDKKLLTIRGQHAIPKLRARHIRELCDFIKIPIPKIRNSHIKPILKEIKTMVKSQFTPS